MGSVHRAHVKSIEIMKAGRVPATLQARRDGQGQDVRKMPLSPGLCGVNHHGEGGVVELLVLVMEEDQLCPGDWLGEHPNVGSLQTGGQYQD